MKNWMLIAMLVLTTLTNAYAEESAEVAKGAAAYNWDTCLNAKLSDCINACTTSEDISCNDSCQSMAKDKCQSEGLSPPQ